MRAIVPIPTAILAMLSTFAVAQAPQPATESASERIDALFRAMDSMVSPGCAISVMRDGEIVYRRGYGMADLDHDVPITPTSVFHVSSMAKQFTAASILLLAQQGELSLDDPVHEYIPELPDFGAPITIRQLIHHTSGLRDQWELLILSGWRIWLDLITNEDVMYVISRQKELNFTPGTQYMYSNTNYTLLGEVVNRVSGDSLSEFTRANIFEPLGMDNTHFRDDHAEIVKNIAYGYEPAEETFRLSVPNFDTVGPTSLLTTVEDLGLWDENFYNPRIGGPEFIRQMLEPGRLNTDERLDYASGLIIRTYRGLNTVSHNGADAGYRSDMVRFPDQRFTSATLCNAANVNPSELNRRVADIYLATQMNSTEAANAGSNEGYQHTLEQLNPYTGTYLNANDFAIRILMKDAKLRAALGGGGGEGFELRALAPNRFRLAAAAVDITFETVEPSDPMQFTLEPEDGQPEVFRAVPPFVPSEVELQEYAGAYSSEEIDPLYTLKLEQGGLVLHRLKASPDSLLPVTRDVFFLRASRASVRFTRSDDGEITGFLLTTGSTRTRNVRFDRDRPAIAVR